MSITRNLRSDLRKAGYRMPHGYEIVKAATKVEVPKKKAAKKKKKK